MRPGYEKALFPQVMGRQSSTVKWRGKPEPGDTHFLRLEERKKGEEPENGGGGVKVRRLPPDGLEHLGATGGGVTWRGQNKEEIWK